MKKLVALLLAMLLIVSGCAGTPQQSGGDTGTPPAGGTETPAAPSDSASPGDEADSGGESPFAVKALDEKTLEVTLSARTPYFLELTAFPTYMPVQQTTVEAHGEAWAVDAATYIGNGPYKVTEWVPGSHITTEKNENYWETDKLGPAKIIFNLIEDPVPQLNAFQAGELKFIDDVPAAETATLKNDPQFHVESQLGTYYISINNQAEPFNNPLVRQAFSLAIDRQHIADVIGEGLWIPATAWIPPGMGDVNPADDFRTVAGDYFSLDYAANLARAKEILAEAGYPDGEGLPVIEYIYNDSSLHSGVAQALQNMWGELGATVNIEVQEWSTFLNTRKNGDYMSARDGWLNDYSDPIGMLDLFISGSGNNNSQYRNGDFDALITKIKGTEDHTARIALLHEAEDTLMNDWVFAPIMYYSDIYMSSSELGNSVWSSPLGYKYFMYAEGIDELPVCIGSNPDTIDPALNSAVDGASMIIHTFEGLYRLDRDGVPEPAVAESVDISTDGLTYTFHIRDDAKWSDGTPVTAEDFVYSWTRAVNPDTAADYGYMFDVIKGYAEIAGDSDH